jgi:hypothetical protein
LFVFDVRWFYYGCFVDGARQKLGLLHHLKCFF